MAKKNTPFIKIKQSKPFKLWDVMLYSLIILLISSLFIVFFVIIPPKAIKGFKITLNQVEIVNYSFEDDSIVVNTEYSEKVIIDIQNKTITIYLNAEKTKYNKISYNTNNKTVWVSESTCSDSKDCVHFNPISSGGQVIYCLPHNLKVLSVGGKVSGQPSTG